MKITTKKLLEYLLEKLNQETDSQKALEQKNKGLRIAAAKGHTEILELLIQEEADLDAQDHNGNTALHHASQI
ncbi:MAG UNVERIFIED_CONTAM: ankyrin repeat domain-containing protein [Rickettsiaceae bacterium]